MRYETTSAVVDRLLTEAAAAHPQECCGLLLGREGEVLEARPARNVSPCSERRFEIDPMALIAAHKAARGGGMQIVGYYHSHPKGDADPSETDAAMAAHDGALWAIVSGTDIGWWRDGPSGFVPVSIAVRQAGHPG